MGKKIAGTCYVKVDGQQLELEGGLEFPFNQIMRETKTAQGRPVGYSQIDAKPYVKGSFIVPKEFPIEKLMESDSMTITAECANGMVYTLSDAWVVGDVAYKPIDGTTDITFEGMRGELG